jgi:adenylosuccinate lyase
VLARLGLVPSRHATQIVQPEWLLDVLHHTVEAHGVLANLADDMRHLQRTEIGEVAEEFGKDQVGSSTMPHKRNPWNFENVKSMWKEALPRIVTHYMDQICEHQRDLTNSASARFIPELFALLDESVLRMERIMGKAVVVRERIAANLAMSKEMVNAEAAYLILASLGHPDAHECIRQKTLESQSTGVPLRTLLLGDPALAQYMERLTPHQREVLEQPERYTGVCERKTEEICAHWQSHWEGNV